MRLLVGVAEEYWEVLRMSQALRIDPTMIETYSAMLFIDRSELFGADTPEQRVRPAGSRRTGCAHLGEDWSGCQ
ncbi:Uncharacterised protein [Mycobacteroides abscessus subsp. abscessus]|nr:Uncharacterised protein [Mycobacteroides abscessus subsp. abscessus]